MISRLKLNPYFRAFGLHAALVVVVSGIYALLGAAQQLPQLWLGGLLGGFNVILILWSVTRLMAKKPIALTVAVSVFKYGFLIALFWLTAQAKVTLGFSFFVGLLLMLPSTGAVLFVLNKNGNSWLTSTGHN